MSFRPRCPKCNSSLWLNKSPHGHTMPEAGCDFCGVRIMGESAIRSLVETQYAEYRQEMILNAEAERLRKAREAALPPRKVAKKVKPRLKAVKPVESVPAPTEAQRRRGSTSLTHCSVCGVHLYRRKKEIDQQDTFFCSRKHQKEYREVRRLKTGTG